MRDRRFAVPAYDLTMLEQRFKIDLALTRKVLGQIPLTMEGEEHKAQRAKFARIIMAGTPAGQAAFEAELATRLAAIKALPAQAPFCLVEDLLRPAGRAMISAMVDIPLADIAHLENIPQTFDDSISIKRRVEIEAWLHQIKARSNHEDVLDRLGAIMLSVDTLIGAMVRSVMDLLSRNPDQPLCAIAWPAEPHCTSLSLVEKICTAPAQIGDASLQEGDRLRLYIEAAGLTETGEHVYSDLYFAVGAHRCVGMALSLGAWAGLTRILSAENLAWRVKSKEIRTMDRVFHFPEKVAILSHDNRI